MSERYVPVSWTRSKLIYDGVLLVATTAFLLAFEAGARRAGLSATPTDGGSLPIRTFGQGAFLLLTVALCIGPLARLDRRFLPLLYNRRHLGIVVFGVAAAHAFAVFDWYFAFSPLNPWLALLVADASYAHLHGFPFVIFGALALLILAVLASTSHDFWLRFLGSGLWKSLHVGIYIAYASVVAHLSFGALQSAQSAALPSLVIASAGTVISLHIAAGLLELRRRRQTILSSAEDRWIMVGAAKDIPNGRARVVRPNHDAAIAIFNSEGRFYALGHRCSHQGGPIGEGRAINDCAICPWHGFEYRLIDGCAPPPFTERVPTYPLRLSEGVLWLDPIPRPLGAVGEAVSLDGATA